MKNDSHSFLPTVPPNREIREGDIPRHARELHAVDATDLVREHRLAMAATRRRVFWVFVVPIVAAAVLLGWWALNG